MSTIIEVTFDPTLWTAGETHSPPMPGDDGLNAYSVWLDTDGVTAWAFEYFGAGFAQFNLADGSIVHQDAMLGVPGYTNYWYNREDGTSMLVQDDQGHYYTIPNIATNPSGHPILYKSHPGMGTPGNLFNGYMIDDATLDLKDTIFSDANFLPVEGWSMPIVPASDGGRYLGICTEYVACGIVNVETMEVVGKFTLDYATAGNWTTIGSITTVGVTNVSLGYATITVTGTFANINVGDFVSFTGITDPNLTFLNGLQFALTTANSSTLAAADQYVGVNDATYGPVSQTATAYISVSVKSWTCWMDKFGDFWFLYSTGTPFTYTGGVFPASDAVYLIKWHPADGATDGVLNCTTNFVSKTTLGTGTDGVQFGTYVPSNHSAFLGGSVAFTGPALNLSLTTFTRNVFHADDLTYFYNGTFDAPESAMDNGVVSGILAIPGDQAGEATQQGGILNLINPESLNLLGSLNVTTAINAQGGLTPVPKDGIYDPFGTMQYNGSVLVVAFEFVGSSVYIVPLAPPTIVFTVTPGSIQLGQSATLSWTVSNATSQSIDNGIGSVSASGTRVVSPTVTTFYHLTASNGVGTVTASVTVVPTTALTIPGALAVYQGQDFILARDLQVWQDKGGQYDSVYTTVGSITLSQPGESLLPVQHIIGYYDATDDQPSVSILPNEIALTNGAAFIPIPDDQVVPEPPTGAQPSVSLLQLRYPVNMVNSLTSQYMHHLQVKHEFPTTNKPHTLKGMAIKFDQD